MSLTVGEKVPDFTVQKNWGETIAGGDLWRESAVLVLFYIFDFSGNLEKG